MIYSKLIGVPRHLNVDYIKEALMKIEDVHSVEDLNVWSLTSGKPTAIVHIQLSMSPTVNAGVGGLLSLELKSVLILSRKTFLLERFVLREVWALQKASCRSVLIAEQ